MRQNSRLVSLALLASVVLLVAAPNAEAAPRPRFGIVAGVNLANLEVDPEGGADFSGLTAFHAGVSLDFPIDGTFTFSTGAIYDMKGQKLEGELPGNLNPYIEADFKLAYITIPALMKLHLGSAGPRPFLLAGGQLGLRTGAEVDYKLTTDLGGGSGTADVENLENIAFDAVFGGGLEFPLGKASRGVLSACYELGLTDIAGSRTFGDVDMYNRTIKLSAGVRF